MPDSQAPVVLLMVQKSGVHQLSWVVYTILYRVVYILSVMIAGFLKHQQYDGYVETPCFQLYTVCPPSQNGFEFSDIILG